MKSQLRKEFNTYIRNAFIKEHPLCQYCQKPAEHVHHIIPLAAGGDNRESNLISLCTQCHGKIHNKNFTINKEAQRKGIERAKKEGKYKGGVKKSIDKKLYLELKNAYLHRQITKTQFAEKLKVSRPTLNKILSCEEEYIQ